MEKTQLEVGDKLTKSQGNLGGKEIFTVTRTYTKWAWAVSGNYEKKFKRALRGNSADPYDRESYTNYCLSSEKDIAEVRLNTAKSVLEARFKAVKNKLTIDQITSLMDILNAIQ